MSDLDPATAFDAFADGSFCQVCHRIPREGHDWSCEWELMTNYACAFAFEAGMQQARREQDYQDERNGWVMMFTRLDAEMSELEFRLKGLEK